MATIYLNNTINYDRVYLAIAASVAVHILLVLIFLNKGNDIIYVENSVRAYENPRISINISKIPESVKPIPTEAPIIKEEFITKTKIDKPLEKAAEKEEFQEAIPVIENATLKGKRTPPVYPRRALMLKQEGEVVLQALISTNGDIKDIKLLTSSGYAILDKSAMDAVWQWKFAPSVINGKPSLSWVKVPVEFIIK